MGHDRDGRRWADVKPLLDEVLDLAPDTRHAYLDRHCAGDQELRRELDDLLALETSVTGFIDRPLLDLLEAPSLEERQGETLGAFRLESLIARGGMGAVYRARRVDGFFEQRVAVKILRRGWISEELLRRFRRERQILADLDHPNIARILDGGSTEDGFPYYAMEYVEGIRLDAFCRREGLSERQRIELFTRVCETVHAAHQRLIVHCDLKPSNILIDDAGRPRLLDFGIAQLLEATDDGKVEGLAETPLGTPRYASPEQLQGQGLTTASDVFSLGAMLHELLVDDVEHTPDPEAPYPFGGDAGPRDPDLKAVVLTACRHRPDERYSSAAELARDLRLYLGAYPVSARSSSTLYSAVRFMRRHPFGSATALGIVALVAAFLYLLSMQLDATTRERDRASTLKDAYLEFIEAIDPFGGEVGAEAANEALEAAMATDLSSDPADRALLLDRLGRIYYRFDFFEEAEGLLREALALRRSLKSPIEIAQSANNLAVVLIHNGNLEEARALIEEAQGLQLAPEFIGRLSRIDVLNNLATAYEEANDLETAERLYQRALGLKATRYGTESPEYAIGLNNLGLVLLRSQRLREAEPLLEQSLKLRRRLYGEDHMTVATSMTNLAYLYVNLGEHQRAVTTNRQILDIRRRHFPENAPSIATAKNSLAFALLGLRDHEADKEAAALLEQASTAHRERLGAEHRTTLIIDRNWAAALVALGRPAEAQDILRSTIELAKSSFPEGHWRIADMRRVLGSALLELGDFQQASRILREVYPELREATGTVKSPYCLEAERWLERLAKMEQAGSPLDASSASVRERSFPDTFKESGDSSIAQAHA